MVITWFGAQYLKLQLGDTIIGINPIGKKANLPTTKFGSAIALVSAERPDMNDLDQLSYGEKRPFAIRGPGEYEIDGIPVVGIDGGLSPDGKVRNTIYVLDFDQMRVCVIGAQKNPNLTSDMIEQIGVVDILFIPIGGGDVLSPAEAGKLAVTLDAKLIIPVHYIGGDAKELATFLKETGAEDEKAEEKLTLKRKDIESFEGEVRVLASSVS
jgi:L-ascorbate metabolism protein UlaG (beta-lactamase superfamily)